MTLPRSQVKEKIIDNSEITSVLREDPVIFDFVSCFYNAQYEVFFEKLIILSDNFLDKDKFF